MTREEAIKLLEHISIAYTPTDAYGDYDDSQPYEDALNMAIEALSAEAVSEDTQIKTELAHIEARLENVEKRLQGYALYGFGR